MNKYREKSDKITIQNLSGSIYVMAHNQPNTTLSKFFVIIAGVVVASVSAIKPISGAPTTHYHLNYIIIPLPVHNP